MSNFRAVDQDDSSSSFDSVPWPARYDLNEYISLAEISIFLLLLSFKLC